MLKQFRKILNLNRTRNIRSNLIIKLMVKMSLLLGPLMGS